MSAIWGVVALDGEEKLPENTKELFETEYKKCRIDSLRSETALGALFGCGVQYVTPQAEKEELPYKDSEQNLMFTADCVLDNRAELIRQLAGCGYAEQQLENMADGGLMYLMFRRMGTDCVKHFRGLFTMAVWDSVKKQLFLFSDQVAGRCLYYRRKGNLVAFSTLLKPLVKLFPETEKNENYYKDFLLASPSVIYVVPGETPYREISLMLPATVAEFDTEGKKEQVYWQQGDTVPGYTEHKCHSPEEYSNAFLALYQACVRDAVVSNGEVGIAMSSGLDSSSVGVLAAKELVKYGKTLHSYTFVPYIKQETKRDGNALYDESDYVKKIAKTYPNIETHFLSNQGKNLFEDMDFCMSLLEMPYKTGTFPNHYEMCTEAAKTGCKVFLNGGFGNNTVSYGEVNHILYDMYKRGKFITLLQWLNRFCKHEKIGRRAALQSLLKNYRIARKKDIESGNGYVPENFYLLPSILKGYPWKARFLADKRTMLEKEYLDRERYLDHLKATALLTYLGIFETKFGLSTGMLLRDPTKDIRLISFCCALPYPMFAQEGVPRWLIRNGFSGLLPEELLNRWRQRGLLNVDWLDRIYRDWNHLKPELLEHLSGTGPEDWVDKERILKDLEEFGQNREKDLSVISHICAIDAMLRFRQR